MTENGIDHERPPEAINGRLVVDVQVAHGDWGNAPLENVAVVLMSVAQQFQIAATDRRVDPIRVYPSADGPPRTLFDRDPDGRVRINIPCKGTLWSQLAYQFAHEFCHVMANFRSPVQHRFHWIEESICETASLFALLKMAKAWEETPPYSNWRDYSGALRSYAQDRLADPRHQVPNGVTFNEWLSRTVTLLESDAYRREDNNVVAARLLPIFASEERCWRAVQYMNLGDANEVTSSADYFAQWSAKSPPEFRGCVNRLEQTLTT